MAATLTTSVPDLVAGSAGSAGSAHPVGLRPADEQSSWRSLRVLTGRNVRKTARVPALLTFSLAMPLLMLLLFSQVFRAIEDSPSFPAGVSYIDFLLPAALAVAVTMNASNSGVAIAIDLSSGVVDRIRSLPIKGWTVLAARSITDTALSVAQMALVTVVAAVVLGFRFQGTAAEALGMFGVLIVFSWAATWLFEAVGAWLRDPETAQMSGMMLMMPLMFASAAFAPVETFPTVLEWFASVNPLSLSVEAARGFALGDPNGADVAQAVVADLVMAAVGFVAASRGYRRSLA
jgi:ABC-2 type transport system permease protein